MAISSPIQEIKERLDVVEFIRSYITLLPAGKNFKAPCPFHKEKTPSFIVSPERQTWHCFGSCSEGGDIIKFLMKYENLEFYEALKILAEKAGIELKKTNPLEHRQFGILYDINDAAKNFFAGQLKNESSAEALKYLLERGLKKETIEEFELGFSNNDFDSLTRHLIKSRFNIQDIERAGLNFKNERGSYVDRFRGRIIFPIYNHFGKVVAFTGRVLPKYERPEFGKYVNSPETLIFSKSKILYGFHKSKEHIRASKSAVLVEGQMDFLMAYQDGVKNIVASSGTALTESHLKSLSRMAEQLVFCFDSDEAGFNAAERAIDLASANDLAAKILTLKDYKDPAEAVQKSPGKFSELVAGAKHAMEFYFKRYLENTDLHGLETDKHEYNIGGLKKNLRIILGKIKNLASPIERSHWLKELSVLAKIEEKVLAEEMEMLKTRIITDKNTDKRGYIGLSQFNNNNQRETVLSRRDLIAQRLLSILSVKEDFKEQMDEYSDYLPVDYLMILKNMAGGADIADSFEKERIDNLSGMIDLRSAFESKFDGDDEEKEEKIKREFYDLICQLKLEYLKEKRQGVSNLIKEAETKGDSEGVGKLMEEFVQINKAMIF
ncbi:MAG: DNA primase [Spirochaetota bacterium]